MTPSNKTKMKDFAQTRLMEVMNLRAVVNEEGKSYIVEGYAARYEPYELYRFDENTVVMEQFTRENFEGADKSDVIFQFDHEGRVYARTSNGTLRLEIDDIGLKVIADLGKTEAARQMYEDIAAGMVTKMSWRFSVDYEDYITTRIEAGETVTYLFTYKAIRKIYDVSAVSIPANQNTAISARGALDGLIEADLARIDAQRKLIERKNALKNWAGGRK